MHLFLTGWKYRGTSWRKDGKRIYDRTKYDAENILGSSRTYTYTNLFYHDYLKVEFDTPEELIRYLSNEY